MKGVFLAEGTSQVKAFSVTAMGFCLFCCICHSLGFPALNPVDSVFPTYIFIKGQISVNQFANIRHQNNSLLYCL